MKKTILLLTTIIYLTVVLTGCEKDDIKCSYDNEFCAYISSEEYNKTGTIIDSYLKGLKKELSDQDKLERLKDWLKCKRCVLDAEILCNSCIYTLPPQSELKIWFTVNGQEDVKILDISMSEPLQFGGYHD